MNKILLHQIKKSLILKLSSRQVWAMVDIFTNGPATAAVHAKKTGCSSAAMTGLYDRMEKMGYIKSTYGLPKDRREISRDLTPAGRKLVIDITYIPAELLEEYGCPLDTSNNDHTNVMHAGRRRA